MSEALARNVREMRNRASWTQEHLAEAADVTVRTVQRVEAGEDVSSETVLALAGAFDVSCDMLQAPLPTEEDARRFAQELGKYKVISLVKVESASDLRNVIGAHCLWMDWVGELSIEQQRAAAVLKDLLHENGDVWGDISATEQVDSLAVIQDALDDLQHLGLVATFGKETLRLKYGTNPEPLAMDALHVLVSKATEPKLFALREKNAPIQFA